MEVQSSLICHIVNSKEKSFITLTPDRWRSKKICNYLFCKKIRDEYLCKHEIDLVKGSCRGVMTLTLKGMVANERTTKAAINFTDNFII